MAGRAKPTNPAFNLDSRSSLLKNTEQPRPGWFSDFFGFFHLARQKKVKKSGPNRSKTIEIRKFTKKTLHPCASINHPPQSCGG
jgi:hypothetical protein